MYNFRSQEGFNTISGSEQIIRKDSRKFINSPKNGSSGAKSFRIKKVLASSDTHSHHSNYVV